jgi:protein phosphatase
MDYRVGAGTNVGNVRDHNEDSFCVNRKAKLYIVADGMGGHAAGEVASNQLKDYVEEYLLREDRPDSVTKCLTQGLQAANHVIYQMGMDDPKKRGMGTTATVMAIDKDQYIIAQVGDSRCYLLRDSELFQLTRDHSRVYQLYESGLITKEEMEDHPMSNVITRSIGNHATVDPDIYQGDLVVGDRFLLCSDGLTGEVSEKEVEGILNETRSPQAAVDRLIQRALEEGGKDNVTCLVIDVRAGDDERRKTIPLTLDQLRQLPMPEATVEQVDLEAKRRQRQEEDLSQEAKGPQVAPAPRSEERRASRKKRQPGLFLIGIGFCALLLVVGLFLLTGKKPGGGIHLVSQPDAAEVYLNNQFRGRTPLMIEGLRAGSYDLRVQSSLGWAQRQVTVEDGALEPLRLGPEDFRKP